MFLEDWFHWCLCTWLRHNRFLHALIHNHWVPQASCWIVGCWIRCKFFWTDCKAGCWICCNSREVFLRISDAVFSYSCMTEKHPCMDAWRSRNCCIWRDTTCSAGWLLCFSDIFSIFFCRDSNCETALSTTPGDSFLHTHESFATPPESTTL